MDNWNWWNDYYQFGREKIRKNWTSRLYKMFFSNKTMVEQCQLFMHLLKMQKMRPILSKLKIRVNKKLERSAIIVKNIFSALNSIGKNSREKDKRASWRVITTSLVSNHLRKRSYMRQTCIDLNLNHTTLRRALSRRERIDDPLQNETWLLVEDFHVLIRSYLMMWRKKLHNLAL